MLINGVFWFWLTGPNHMTNDSDWILPLERAYYVNTLLLNNKHIYNHVYAPCTI